MWQSLHQPWWGRVLQGVRAAGTCSRGRGLREGSVASRGLWHVHWAGGTTHAPIAPWHPDAFPPAWRMATRDTGTTWDMGALEW